MDTLLERYPPDSIHCANTDFCGIYEMQADGLEPGQWIGAQWWCCVCLEDFKTRRWQPGDWYAIVDTEPDLADWLMAMAV